MLVVVVVVVVVVFFFKLFVNVTLIVGTFISNLDRWMSLRLPGFLILTAFSRERFRLSVCFLHKMKGKHRPNRSLFGFGEYEYNVGFVIYVGCVDRHNIYTVTY